MFNLSNTTTGSMLQDKDLVRPFWLFHGLIIGPNQSNGDPSSSQLEYGIVDDLYIRL